MNKEIPKAATAAAAAAYWILRQLLKQNLPKNKTHQLENCILSPEKNRSKAGIVAESVCGRIEFPYEHCTGDETWTSCCYCYCCHCHPCYRLQSRASKEDATSWESNQSWIQTEYSKSIWSTEVGEGKRQSEARIRFRRNGTREWSEGGDSSMILRACYWGTRLCHCMECMVKNARQGIDQSHASHSNIHRTFLWSVNKPRVPFPSLPSVFCSQ